MIKVKTAVQPTVSAKELVDCIVEAIRSKKGHDISVLDLRKLESPIADYFIVCSGRSDTQNNAIADEIQKLTKETLHERPAHVEGERLGEWILLDYIDVVVHVFLPRIRDYFRLEDLWGDADITHFDE